MDLLKAAAIAKFSYTTLPQKTGKARIQLKGKDVKYNYAFIEKNNTQAYILEDDNDVIIVVRGSKEIEDIKDVFSVKKTYVETVGTVHEGFSEGFYDLYDEVDEVVNNTDKKLYFIGHSLGGSVAKLMGLFYRYENVTTITFGEPRGCWEKISSGNSEFIRVSNNMDMIPRIHVRYTHGVKEETHVYFNRKGEEIVNPTGYREFMDVVTNFILRIFGLVSIFEIAKDHLMDAYITLLS